MSSPNNTTVLAGSGEAIVDNNGTVWTIKGGRVVRNGVPDTFTANVTELAFKNGVLWQENSSHLWYAKVGNAPGNYHGWAAGTYIAPVPVNRTFLGGSAGNPAAWSDHGVPQPGDTLTMAPGATMNLTGVQLQGDTLNVANGSTATINISGVTDLNLNSGSSLGSTANTTVNLAAHSEWIGGFDVAPYSKIAVNGAGTFANTYSLVIGRATVAPNVVGNGTFVAAASHGGYGKLVDDVKDFHATTNLSLGDLLLKGVTASSYAFEGNTLVLNTTQGRAGPDREQHPQLAAACRVRDRGAPARRGCSGRLQGRRLQRRHAGALARLMRPKPRSYIMLEKGSVDDSFKIVR